MRRLGILCLGVLLWLLFRTLGKKTELRLFENGQIALARVTGSSTRSRFMPSLAYEFTDPKGVVTCGEPMVLGGTVVEGDSIIVFYDPVRPSVRSAGVLQDTSSQLLSSCVLLGSRTLL